MGSRIIVEDVFEGHWSNTFGLRVESDRPFPLLIGSSIRVGRRLIDVPPMWIMSEGLGLFGVALHRIPDFPHGILEAGEDTFGQTILALWADRSFKHRLAETPWMDCAFQWMIGASATGFNMVDEFIADKYAGRLDAIREEP